MVQDEEIYLDPDSFRPERFFNDDGTLNNNTVQHVFGFGRRYVVFGWECKPLTKSTYYVEFVPVDT